MTGKQFDNISQIVLWSENSFRMDWTYRRLFLWIHTQTETYWSIRWIICVHIFYVFVAVFQMIAS